MQGKAAGNEGALGDLVELFAKALLSGIGVAVALAVAILALSANAQAASLDDPNTGTPRFRTARNIAPLIAFAPIMAIMAACGDHPGHPWRR